MAGPNPPPGHPKGTSRRLHQVKEPVLAVGAPKTGARNAQEIGPSLYPRRHAHSVRRWVTGAGKGPQLQREQGNSPLPVMSVVD